MVQESNQSSAEYGPMKRTIQFDDSPPPKHRQIHRPTFTHSNETVLCTACKDAFSKESVKADDFRRRRRNQHHESSEDLAKAVEKGCYFCKRFARHSADPSISTVLNDDLILHPRPDPVRLFFAGSEQRTGRAWREDDLDDLVCFNLLKRSPDDEPPARLSPPIKSLPKTFRDTIALAHHFNIPPLYKRGWVFQERLLPKRTLHFGKDQVFWKCRRRLACESLPDGIPVAPDNDVVEREKGVARIRRMRPQEEEDSPEDEETFATVWEHLVEEYSGFSLTYEKDKLAALNGMTGIFSNASLSRYISGIWNTHIARQICWSLNPAAERKPRPAHPAPSWSWASVQGKVSFKAIVNSDESILHLARHIYHSAHSNAPAGRRIPLGGYISMSGSVYTLKVSDMSNDGVSLSLDGRSERLDYNPFVFDFYRKDLLPVEVVILPLMCTREPPVNAEGVEIAGLILHPLGYIIDDCGNMALRGSYRYCDFIVAEMEPIVL
ncbi:heterokaryon incompatibility protein [Colletotrichum filicis]|nr:heterokaryon incompatibility protein [Colletotrichum filicis]